MKLARLVHASWFVALALNACVGDVSTDETPLSDGAAELTCPKPADIDPLRELVIVDSQVVTSREASNANGSTGGRLSFHHMMSRLAGDSTNVAQFTEAFLRSWAVDHKVGAGTVKGTPNGGLNQLLDPSFWPRLASGDLDMTRAPFRLLAVVYRPDLASKKKKAGEGRLVFGLVSPAGNGMPMTVIFEFNLPGPTPRKTWAKRWHSLLGHAAGDDYNGALSRLVERFTERTNLAQVRTSEVFLSNEWVLREFHLDTTNNALVTATTAQSPDASFNNTQELVDWVNANAEAILDDTHVVPAKFLGGRASMAFPALMNFNFSGTQWLMSNNGTPLVEAELRHAFASQTCNGCHQSDVPEGGQPIDVFYQVSPLQAVNKGDGTDRLSPFIRKIEFARRALRMSDILCGH